MPQLPDKCVPCEGDASPLTAAEAAEHKEVVPDWSLDDGKISRRWKTKDFRAALAFANRVGMLAEEEGHHPDIHLTGYNHVELELSTHAIGGLSVNDFVLARKIDQLSAKDDLSG